MNPEPLQQYLQLYSYLIIPVSLLEGWLLSRLAQKLQWKVTGFFPNSAAALLLQLLLFFFLTSVPRFVSENSWRLVPSDHWDNTLYFFLILLLVQLLKLTACWLLCGKQSESFSFKKQIFLWGILFFWLFNGSILSGSFFCGSENLGNSTYNISYSFPHGIDYFVRGRDDSFSDVSQRDRLGRMIRLNQVVLPYSCEEGKITFFHTGTQNAGEHTVSADFDSKTKSSPDGKVTASAGKYGGLILVKNGQIIKLNRQSLLHRWEPADFVFIPDRPCILFSVADENYVYDYHRLILYPLLFSKGRIFAFGIRDTEEQHYLAEKDLKDLYNINPQNPSQNPGQK